MNRRESVMSFKFNLYDKILDCLKSNPDKRFTARQITEWIFAHYRKDCERKRSESKQDLSDNNKLFEQISAQFKPSLFRNNDQIKITAGRPRQYYWTEATDEQEIETAEIKETAACPLSAAHERKLSESDLYPLLAQYLYTERGTYAKRIDEKTSKNNRGENGNKWLHPDLVGLEQISQNWGEEIKKCASALFSPAVRLSAYEVKLKLNSANVREAFFKAVSNASWANFGYLVAAEIDGKIENELRLLSNLHGIGIIQLDAETPAESQIMIPSAERDIDWGTADRRASENKDFLEYIKCVRETVTIGRIKAGDWYKITDENN